MYVQLCMYVYIYNAIAHMHTNKNVCMYVCMHVYPLTLLCMYVRLIHHEHLYSSLLRSTSNPSKGWKGPLLVEHEKSQSGEQMQCQREHSFQSLSKQPTCTSRCAANRSGHWYSAFLPVSFHCSVPWRGSAVVSIPSDSILRIRVRRTRWWSTDRPIVLRRPYENVQQSVT